MIRFAFLAITLLAAPAARAQFGSEASITYFGVGGNALDTGNLSDRIGARGYGSLEPGGVGFATARYQFRGRLVGGIEGHTTQRDEARNGAFEASLSGRYATLNVGYLAYSTERLKLYPLVGGGYGDLTLRLYEDATDPDFDGTLDNPRRGSSLSSRGWLLNAGLGGDFIVPIRKSEDHTRGLAFGLRAGYLLDLSSGDWEQFSEFGVDGGPEASLAGPYLRLLIGFSSVEAGR
ncbi:MAG: hypothetical protein ABJF88_14620 [Rhodothermales bacterium]